LPKLQRQRTALVTDVMGGVEPGGGLPGSHLPLSFSIGARWNPQLLPTDLALIAVPAFDDLDHDAVANLALYHRRDAEEPA
jgi:hypothetical protein